MGNADAGDKQSSLPASPFERFRTIHARIFLRVALYRLCAEKLIGKACVLAQRRANPIAVCDGNNASEKLRPSNTTLLYSVEYGGLKRL
jgi:hypothetical protein